MDLIENSNIEQNILKPVSKDSFRINIVCKCGVCPDCVFYDSEKSGSENEKEIIEAFSCADSAFSPNQDNQVNMEKIKWNYNCTSPHPGCEARNLNTLNIRRVNDDFCSVGSV